MFKAIWMIILIMLATSCERAVNSDTTTVFLQLPNSNSLNLSANSVFMRSLDVVNSFNTTSNQQYLDILPTGFDNSTDAPINCYLVTVTGPEDFMNLNYCGNDDGTGNISKDYTFGSYLGYVSSGSELSLEVPSGKNRKIRLFGFHATDSSQCKDVRANPLKNTMSFPYFVGKSQELNLSGIAQDVVVTLINPDISGRIDSCKFNVLNATETEANSTIINTSYFPYGSIRVPSSVGHTCEQFNINLYNQGNTFNPAGLLFSTSYSLQATTDGTNFITRPMYSTYERCNLNVSSQEVFFIPANNTSRIMWGRFVSTDNNIIGLRVSPTDLNLSATNTEIVTSTTPNLSYKFDLFGVPTLLLNEECYPFKLAIRNLYGEQPPVIVAGDYTILASIDSSDVGGIYSDSSCTSIVPTISFTANQTVSSQLYIKLSVANPTTERGKFTITKTTGSANLLTTEIPFKVSHNQPIPNVKLSRVSLTGVPVVVSSIVADRCIPITIHLRDNNNLPFKLTAASSFELLLNDTSAIVNDLSFYLDSACSVSQISAAVPVPISTGSHSYTLYMKVANSASTGPRNVIYKVNNLITSKYYFNIIYD